ncbi:uncharacterized protein LOC141599634 isoform X4 [Silene latifolia]|uniref:uncharacterized protein LOC141599634 isoform X4 n=1 Tax=Silene latifolia TaxID=37657 RepID=UPI003D774A3D
MAGAASGFVTKTFQSMLKESFAKKFTTLHFAIQSYLDDIKEEKKQHVSKRTKSFIQWSQNGSFTKIFLIKAFIFKINSFFFSRSFVWGHISKKHFRC